MILSCIIIAPLACVMGMPFPLALKQLAESRAGAIPWAWGINGCMSVIAAPLATLVAVEAGFVVVMTSAAGVYGIAALSVERFSGPLQANAR